MHILIDFDSTLVNTSKAYFNYYREITRDLSTIYSEDKVSWNMKDLCPLWNTQEQADDVYIQEGFFKHLELYPNVIEILNKLKKKGYYLHIVSCHNIKGSKFKVDWIKKNLPMIDEVTIIPIENGMHRFDKSGIKADMIIDDKIDALDSANTEYKILYGNYEWNKDCNKYNRVTNWKEVYKYIHVLQSEEGEM